MRLMTHAVHLGRVLQKQQYRVFEKAANRRLAMGRHHFFAAYLRDAHEAVRHRRISPVFSSSRNECLHLTFAPAARHAGSDAGRQSQLSQILVPPRPSSQPFN